MRSLLLVLLVVAAPALAQEREEPRADPAVIEKAVERRVGSWLRDRTTQKLGCKARLRNHAKCGDCAGTGVDPRKVDDALWRYFRPGFRRANDKDRWIAETVLGRWKGRWSGWGLKTSHSLAGDDLSLIEVLACRDVVWAVVAKGAGDAVTYVRDTWVREEGNYFLDMTVEPVPDQLQHPWFVLGTLSVNRLQAEATRLWSLDQSKDLTELGRATKKEERTKGEAELRTRRVADRAIVINVAPKEGAEGTYSVMVHQGMFLIRFHVSTPPGEDAAALEARLAALARGTRVYFRGQVKAWSWPEDESVYFIADLTDAEVSAE